MLLQVEFWRVCLDEAQTVESTTAKAAEMASKLHAGCLPCRARGRVSCRVEHAASRACLPRCLSPPARAPTHALTGLTRALERALPRALWSRGHEAASSASTCLCCLWQIGVSMLRRTVT